MRKAKLSRPGTSALQLAEPLRPWSGPMAEALQLGQAFAVEEAEDHPRVDRIGDGFDTGSARRDGAAPGESVRRYGGRPAADIRQ
jgi:hypothetical protein